MITLAAFHVFAACMALAPGVLAHGRLEHPQARHLCNRSQGRYAGFFAIGTGDTFPQRPSYLGGMPGWWGDPIPRVHAHDPVSNFAAGGPDWGCEPQETFQEGGVMELTWVMAANHGGFFKAHVCDSTNLSDECFNKHELLTCAPSPIVYHCTEEYEKDFHGADCTVLNSKPRMFLLFPCMCTKPLRSSNPRTLPAGPTPLIQFSHNIRPVDGQEPARIRGCTLRTPLCTHKELHHNVRSSCASAFMQGGAQL